MDIHNYYKKREFFVCERHMQINRCVLGTFSAQRCLIKLDQPVRDHMEWILKVCQVYDKLSSVKEEGVWF